VVVDCGTSSAGSHGDVDGGGQGIGGGNSEQLLAQLKK
jgi:hypothetical protein